MLSPPGWSQEKLTKPQFIAKVKELYSARSLPPPTHSAKLDQISFHVSKLDSIDPEQVMEIGWNHLLKEAGYYTFRISADAKKAPRLLTKVFRQVLRKEPFNSFGFYISPQKITALWLHRILEDSETPFSYQQGQTFHYPINRPQNVSHPMQIVIMNPLGKISRTVLQPDQNSFDYPLAHEGLYWFELIAYIKGDPTVNQLFPLLTSSPKKTITNTQLLPIKNMIPQPFQKVVEKWSPQEDVLTMLNQLRQVEKSKGLKLDKRLNQTALNHARILSNFFLIKHRLHTKKGVKERLTQKKIKLKKWGEVIAYAETPAKAMEKLMRSPGHAQTLLKKSFTHCGIGINPFINPISKKRFTILVIDFIEAK